MESLERAGALCRLLLREIVEPGEELAALREALHVWMDPAAVEAFLDRLPEIRELARGDVRAAMEGDPAAVSREEVMQAYPGFRAVTIQRMAHVLWKLGVPLLPRLMTEYAHSATGIDIHPGARLGRRFFIDHGTGVVIGETAVIGDQVKLYQGVTLGGLSTRDAAGLRGKKRHPTIGDRVTVYANATILGGETVIGADCVIGANVFLTGSVPPGTTVRTKRQELEIFER